MAQRRMFSKKITETDLFLDMPMSAQCLYFHLNMSADDDGFIGNAKTIRRMIGASEDDLKLLLAKEFLIPFDNGVVVIKDWKIHNYIQKDRYNETIYKDEKSTLVENESKQYQRLNRTDTKCIQNVSSSDTQVRLGKDRLGKDRLGKDSTSRSKLKFETHHLKLAELLYKQIQSNSPNFKEPNLEKWANEFRLMMDRDKREGKEIQKLIIKTQNDDFWKKNILSPAKLRKHYDRLIIEFEDDNNFGTGNNTKTRNKTFDYLDEL